MKISEKRSLEDLRSLILSLNSENAFLQTQNTSLHNEISCLKEQLNWLQKQLFGKKSEKEITANDEQLTFDGFLDFEASQEEITAIKAHTRKVSKNEITKITLPSNLPIKEIILDLTEEEKTDQHLQKIGEEISLKLVQKSSSFYIKKIVRPKYASSNKEGIKIADMPSSIIPKCRVDESILADIITKKYADHLPLYRISEDYARSGIGISRQLLSKWMIKIGLTLKPLCEEMKRRVLLSENIFIDETPIAMQDSPKVKQAYLWVMTGGKEKDPYYRVYNFKLNRNHENAKELLKNYHGIVHSDKYGAYVQLAEQKQFIWIPCFSHIRRKFIEAQTDPNFTKYILRKIKYLYMFEKIAWEKSEEERLKIRQEKEIPIIDELIKAVKDKLQDRYVLPKSKLKEALGYFYSLIPYLKNYTKHAQAHIDNNVAERAVRPIAIGRKNWLFIGSPDSGEACSILLSLTQTCRALNINPRSYFDDILRRFMDHNFSKLYELLPDEWIKSHSLNE